MSKRANQTTLQILLGAFLISMQFLFSTVCLAVDYQLSVQDVSVEVSESSGTMTVTVELDTAIAGDDVVSVDYTFSDGAGTNSAISGSDYSASNGSLTFSGEGTTSGSVTVTISDESIVEPDETFTFELTSGSETLTNGEATDTISIADNSGTITIINDDVPTLTIDDVAAQDEGTGTDTNFVFTVQSNLTIADNAAVSFEIDADNIGGAGFTDSADFSTATASGTISSGDSATATLVVTGDNVVEADETFTVAFTSASVTDSAVTPVIDDTAGSTITNDDVPTLTIDDVAAQDEGTGTDTNFVFTVHSDLTIADNAAVSFEIGADNIGGAGFTDSADFSTATASGTISSGDSSTATLVVTGDSVVEADETFTVAFTSASVTDSTVTPVIDDTAGSTVTNDDVPTLTIDDVAAQDEGTGTDTNFIFTVQSDLTIADNAAVSFEIGADNIGGAGFTDSADFSTATASGTISSGDSATATLVVTGDSVVEADETFTVAFTSASVTDSDSHPRY